MPGLTRNFTSDTLKNVRNIRISIVSHIFSGVGGEIPGKSLEIQPYLARPCAGNAGGAPSAAGAGSAGGAGALAPDLSAWRFFWLPHFLILPLDQCVSSMMTFSGFPSASFPPICKKSEPFIADGNKYSSAYVLNCNTVFLSVP